MSKRGTVEYHYAHDLHGALVRGYARRLRTAINAAVIEAAGWMRPYDPTTASARLQISMTLSILLEKAHKLGMTEEEISDMLEKEKATNEFGCPAKARVNSLKHDSEPFSEDPTHGADWSEFDAYVKTLSQHEAQELLKSEARLRRNAQIEAGIPHG